MHKNIEANTRSALDFAAGHQEENLQHLLEFLRFPSISTSPEHRGDIERAAAWLAQRLTGTGLDRVEVIPTGGHPLVYGEWMGAGDEAPTVLVYGHYDVQPTDPDDEWVSPPFEPVVRDGNLYARGTSDDKGQLYTHLAAAEAFFRTAGGPPVNLKFLIEGEEEIGGSHVNSFVRKHREMLACDAALISDTAMVNAQTPAIVVGLRGLVYVEIEVRGPGSDLHSGIYGGVAHNPLQVVSEIIAALHDEHGRVTIPGFYDDVRPLSDEERAELSRIPFDPAGLRAEMGAPAVWTGEEGYTALERMSSRPTLEIHGIGGGFTGAGQKTVIPARAVVKASCRLVPDQDPSAVAQSLEQYVLDLAPSTVKVEVRTITRAQAVLVERDTPAMRAAVKAYRRGFGSEPVFLRSGGGVGVVVSLTECLHVPVILMGFGLPDDNLHAPNEKLSLSNFQRGICTSIHFMSECAAQRRS